MRKDLITRIEENSIPEPMSGCWLWLGRINREGYGFIRAEGRSREGHRVSYEAHRGSVPAGLVLDHTCRCRSCVNPDHLEPVTQQVNILRGTSPSAMNADKTACVHGHPFEGKNLAYKTNGSRVCRACNRMRQRKCKDRRLRGAA